ncbi:MAG: thioredoxin family protein, partial [Desulfuromonadales bacterium]|nr:thioredoxin family protein [Desulfuromonadales bacterium]
VLKMRVLLLGDNCKTCSMLKNNIELAIKREKSLVEFSQVSDPEIFVSYGIMSLPGIAIDGKLRTEGRLLSVEEVIAMISDSS